MLISVRAPSFLFPASRRIDETQLVAPLSMHAWTRISLLLTFRFSVSPSRSLSRVRTSILACIRELPSQTESIRKYGRKPNRRRRSRGRCLATKRDANRTKNG